MFVMFEQSSEGFLIFVFFSYIWQLYSNISHTLKQKLLESPLTLHVICTESSQGSRLLASCSILACFYHKMP